MGTQPSGDEDASERRFGLAGGSAFGIVAFFFALGGAPRASAVLSGAGALLLAGAAVRPAVLRPIQRCWEAAGRVLSAIQTRLALFLCFVLVLAPLGLLLRLFGRDALSSRPNPACLTYFEDRQARTFPPKSFELRF